MSEEQEGSAGNLEDEQAVWDGSYTVRHKSHTLLKACNPWITWTFDLTSRCSGT